MADDVEEEDKLILFGRNDPPAARDVLLLKNDMEKQGLSGEGRPPRAHCPPTTLQNAPRTGPMLRSVLGGQTTMISARPAAARAHPAAGAALRHAGHLAAGQSGFSCERHHFVQRRLPADASESRPLALDANACEVLGRMLSGTVLRSIRASRRQPHII